MRQSHQDTIASLLESGTSYGWKIDSSPNSITAYKTILGKTISIVLEREPTGYVLCPVEYRYQNKISYLDYGFEEQRWSRNKNILFAFINLLKRAGIWDLIKNKNSFLKVNESNKKTGKETIGFLKELLGENIVPNKRSTLKHKKIK
jgi:hypothetical protein